jgi:hypothetical protein
MDARKRKIIESEVENITRSKSKKSKDRMEISSDEHKILYFHPTVTGTNTRDLSRK